MHKSLITEKYPEQESTWYMIKQCSRIGYWQYLQKIIFDLKGSGIGVLITDHNVRETLSVTDRAYIINEGRIFRTGTPEQLGNDPEVKRVYLGESFSFV